jgi:hypothetical protein
MNKNLIGGEAMRKEQVLTPAGRVSQQAKSQKGGEAMRRYCFTYEHNSGAQIIAYCVGLEKHASGYINALFEIRYKGKEAEGVIDRWIDTYGYYDARKRGVFERHMIEDLVEILGKAFPEWLGLWWFMYDYEELENLAKEVKRRSGKSWLELSNEVEELLQRNGGDVFYATQCLNKYLEGNERWECIVHQELHYISQFIVDYIGGKALDEKLYREIENHRR